MLNKHSSRHFQPKKLCSRFFSPSSLVSISAFYVSFKYYHVPVRAQLNRNATSILRQMQSKHRDQEPNERHAQERKGSSQRRLPQLRNLRLPNRKGLAAHLKPRAPLQYFSTLNHSSRRTF